MDSILLAFISILFLSLINAHGIKDKSPTEDNSKSEASYIKMLEDFLIFMIQERKELMGYRQELRDLREKCKKCEDKTKEMLTFHLQQFLNKTSGQDEELKELRKEKQEMSRQFTLLEKSWNSTKADLRLTMTKQSNELTECQQELGDLKQEWENKTKECLSCSLQQLNITSGHENKLDNLRKDTQMMSQKEDTGFVGFTVTFEAHDLQQHDSILKPSKFVTDYSSLFSDKGEFVCKRDGIYVFFFHLVTNSRSNGAQIYKNDIPMTLTWQDGPGGSTVVSGTASLVTDLRMWDKISIKSYKDNLSVNDTSVWSGHLISQKLNGYIVRQSTLKKNGNSEAIFGDKMISNIGNAKYSMKTGEFVCTRTGFYKVDINTVGSVNSSYEGVDVRVNGKKILGYAISWHFPQGFVFSSSSNTAVLNLKSGDNVTLKTYFSRYLNLTNDSTFSIYILSTDFDVNGFSCHGSAIVEGKLTCNLSPSNNLNSKGYFTCKDEGYYYFSINLVTQSANNGIQIYKNEVPLTQAWVGTNWSSYSTASTSLVANLKVGDYITFRKMRNNLRVDSTTRVVGYKIYPWSV